MLKSISPHGMLSFGSNASSIDLMQLNVIVGPNGSGKSNFIDLILLIRSTTKDMRSVIRKGGGMNDWIWKGAPTDFASIAAAVSTSSSFVDLVHSISIGNDNNSLVVNSEEVTRIDSHGGFTLYRASQVDPPRIWATDDFREINRLNTDRSILAQVRDPDIYPEITSLAATYDSYRIYRDWCFGRYNILRTHQSADAPNDYLEEDLSNIGLILNRLSKSPKAKRTIIERLADLYDGLTDFGVSVEGGTVQVFLTEGDYTIPATRLSDGTLRYLCLLAILCDPNPPPLICIEEPELGLHPDIIPKIADLLVEASERTQLIVTTHSDILIDAMTERPECVLVCEKHDGQTTVERLDKEELAKWLEKYRLGALWLSGEIGGMRW